MYRSRTTTTYSVTVDPETGLEVELTWEPAGACDPLIAKVGDMYVVAYVTHDDSYRDIDDLMGDGMGKLYSFHRHASRDDHRAGLEALGNTSDGEPDIEAVYDKHMDAADTRYVQACMLKYPLPELLHVFSDEGDYPVERLSLGGTDEKDDEYVERALYLDAARNKWDNTLFYHVYEQVLTDMWGEDTYFPGDRDACLLACYQHGGESWSLSGQGMQCRWDTSNSAGVWVPDPYLRIELDGFKGEERRAKAKEYCSQFLRTYNDIVNGCVYGLVVEWYDKDGKDIDNDHCWGFVGYDDIESVLRSDYFDPTCQRLQAEYDKAVMTQNGKQKEMEL